MKVTYKSRGRMGNQSKTIYVTCNDPDQKTVKLIIKGNVLVLLRASPASLNFGEVFRGTSKTMTLKLIPGADIQFEIDRIELPNSEFVFSEVRKPGAAKAWKKIVKSTKEGLVKKFGSMSARAELLERQRATRFQEPVADVEGTRTISVTILPTATIGNHSGKMKIYTDLEKKKLLQVAVYGRVTGNIQVRPQAHNFGTIGSGQAKETAFNIARRGGKTFSIKEVETSSEYVSVQLSDVRSGAEYELKVEILPGAPEGRLAETVKLHTDDPDQSEIEIKLYGNVRD